MRYLRIDKQGVLSDRIFESDDELIDYINEVIAEDNEETSFINNIEEAKEYMTCFLGFRLELLKD